MLEWLIYWGYFGYITQAQRLYISQYSIYIPRTQPRQTISFCLRWVWKLYASLFYVPRQYLIQPALSDTVITVTSNAVFQNLLKLNLKKAHGPDGIPSWLLKENEDLLAGPIAAILNCSYRECTLPPVWKKADVGTVLSLITLISFLNNLETVFTMNMLVF
jgi:hypothetical protein